MMDPIGKDDVHTIANDEKSPQFYHDGSSSEEGLVEGVSHLHRKLSGRQIQMIAIGGSIGTALFVSIGYGLLAGGPGSLFIAFAIYSGFLGLINNCMAEMTIFMPVSGSWIRMASKWVDEVSILTNLTFRSLIVCRVPASL